MNNGQKLLQTSVAVYVCPSDPGPALNQFYANPAGSSNSDHWYSKSNYLANQNIIHKSDGTFSGPPGARPTSIRDITDGTSNTLLLGERALKVVGKENGRATGGVLWGRPANNADASTCFHPNYPINATDPTDDFRANSYSAPYSGATNSCNSHGASSAHAGGAQFAMADGTVHFISENIAINPIGPNNPAPAPQGNPNNPGCTTTNYGAMAFTTGPGFVYNNLYHRHDGNPIGEF